MSNHNNNEEYETSPHSIIRIIICITITLLYDLFYSKNPIIWGLLRESITKDSDEDEVESKSIEEEEDLPISSVKEESISLKDAEVVSDPVLCCERPNSNTRVRRLQKDLFLIYKRSEDTTTIYVVRRHPKPQNKVNSITPTLLNPPSLLTTNLPPSSLSHEHQQEDTNSDIQSNIFPSEIPHYEKLCAIGPKEDVNVEEKPKCKSCLVIDSLWFKVVSLWKFIYIWWSRGFPTYGKGCRATFYVP